MIYQIAEDQPAYLWVLYKDGLVWNTTREPDVANALAELGVIDCYQRFAPAGGLSYKGGGEDVSN